MRAWRVRTIEQLTRPQVLATIAPALVTYVTSAVGLYFTDFTLVELDAGSPGILGAAFGVVLFTLSVIVYRSGLTKGTGVLSGARRIDVTMSITRIPL